MYVTRTIRTRLNACRHWVHSPNLCLVMTTVEGRCCLTDSGYSAPPRTLSTCDVGCTWTGGTAVEGLQGLRTRSRAAAGCCYWYWLEGREEWKDCSHSWEGRYVLATGRRLLVVVLGLHRRWLLVVVGGDWTTTGRTDCRYWDCSSLVSTAPRGTTPWRALRICKSYAAVSTPRT
jgi:hypothetical protein